MRLLLLAPAALALLAACATPPATPRTGPDGRPLPQVYRIREADSERIQFRMLDSLNALRRAAGAPEVQFNASLNAAAATHSRDMSVQNRPWNFGSDGSSPLDRVRRAGYEGQFLSENISETYETELETLAAWMEDPTIRANLLNSRARQMGFEWFQEPNGKIWWTLILGT